MYQGIIYQNTYLVFFITPKIISNVTWIQKQFIKILLKQLKGKPPGIGWYYSRTPHLTLAFLEDIEKKKTGWIILCLFSRKDLLKFICLGRCFIGTDVRRNLLYEFLLVIYCCVTDNCPQNQGLTITNMYLTISVVQKFESCVTGWFYLMISHEIIKISPGVAVI